MLGFRFSKFTEDSDLKSRFERLRDLFADLLLHTSGDVQEAINWLRTLDKAYDLTGHDYNVDDFLKDMENEGYLKPADQEGKFKITVKSEQIIRKRSLEEVFGLMRKGGQGRHITPHTGQGIDAGGDRRPFEFGDRVDQIDITASLHNAQINHGINDFTLHERDLEIVDNEYNTQMATVVMIDISHSMILYGEDRITPAKKVAIALSELITQKYPGDMLDIVVFGNDARKVNIKDLPYLEVGPFHTNTVAGLELAMDILQKKKVPNRQIFMITDGKPTCIKDGIKYYKNSMGMDPYIINRTMNEAVRCRKAGIPVTTYMIARDPFLQQFVKDFTKANQGKAFYTTPDKLGQFMFEDYTRNRRKWLK